MPMGSAARQRDLISIHNLLNHQKKPNHRSESACNKYLAQKILNDIRNCKTIDLLKASYFNQLELFDFPSICVLFNKFLDQDIKQDLLDLLFLSRSSKDIDLACSNAITILAKSDFSFNDLDLSNIRIPKADLSQCLLINVNFENCNLKEVKFLQSQLYKVNFKNCDLSNAKFGFAMKINWQYTKGLFFSADDDYFYYKTNDVIMEMDLKNQQFKFMLNLRDFVSSRITNILRTKENKYCSELHGQYLGIWAGSEHKVLCSINMTKIAISPNLKYLAGITENKPIVVCWDTEKQVLGAEKTTIYKGAQLSFSPCSRYLAIIKKNCIYLIKTESWTCIKSIQGKFTNKCSLAFSYCGGKIALNDSSRVLLIDIATKEKVTVYQNNLKPLTRGVSFSPCGKFLAFESNESAVYVVDIDSGNTTQIITGFSSNVVSVLFSNLGKYISLSDFEGNIKIYEFFPKFIKNDYNWHLKILETKLSPKGTYLLTRSIENSILWDLRGFKPKQIKIFSDDRLSDLYVFSPSDTYLAIRKFPIHQIYDLKHNCWLSAKNFSYRCFYMTFSYYEEYLICLNINCYEYFRISNMKFVRKIEIQHSGLKSIKFSECGKFHYWKYSANNIFIWDLEKDYFINRIALKENYKLHAFTPLLTQIAIVSETFSTEYYVEVWDRNSSEAFSLNDSNESITRCCFSPNKKYIVAGYESGNIIIWDIKNESIKEKFRSLLGRYIDTIEIANDIIVIRENDNVEIFRSDKLS